MLCQTCKHALFNELWGDWKCKIGKHFIWHHVIECPNFVIGEPEVSKEDRYIEE